MLQLLMVSLVLLEVLGVQLLMLGILLMVVFNEVVKEVIVLLHQPY